MDGVLDAVWCMVRPPRLVSYACLYTTDVLGYLGKIGNLGNIDDLGNFVTFGNLDIIGNLDNHGNIGIIAKFLKLG